MATRAELQTRLAAAFANQGWPYEHEIVPAVLDEMERRGQADGAGLAEQVPSHYMRQHGISAEQMTAVLTQTLDGQTVEPSPSSVTSLVVNDHSHPINIGVGATVTESRLNTGQQLIVHAESDKSEVLAAVAALVRTGLAGDWNEAAARELAQIIDAADNTITVEDVRKITKDVAEDEAVGRGKIEALVERIATGAVSGALGHGITAGLGGLF